MIHQLEEFDFSILEEKENQILGFNLFVNPLNQHVEYIKKHQLLKVTDVDNTFLKKEVRVVAVLSRIKTIKTKNGDKYVHEIMADFALFLSEPVSDDDIISITPDKQRH